MNLKNIVCSVLVIIAILFQSCNLKSGKTIEFVIEIIPDVANDQSEIDRAIEIITMRLEQFESKSFGIKEQTKKNQYIVRIENINDEDIPKVKNLITYRCDLSFWETYDFSELSTCLMKANEKVANYYTNKNKETENKERLNDTTISLVDLIYVNDSLFDPSRPLEKSLFTLLLPNTVQQNGQYYSGKGPIIGRAEIKDTAIVNLIFKMESIKNLFPKDLKLLWTGKPIKNEYGRVTTILELIALKKDVNGKAALSGNYISDARHDFSSGGDNEITIIMNDYGTKIWGKLTADNIGKSIAIVLDDYVYSYPTVQSEIPNGRSSITGDFTLHEAKDLANVLKGNVSYVIKIIGQKN